MRCIVLIVILLRVGHIVKHRATFRDYMIIRGLIPALIGLIESTTSIELLREILIVISHISISHERPPCQEAVVKLLPPLEIVISHSDAALVVEAQRVIGQLKGTHTDMSP
jgi:hypothetical protein